MALAVGFIGAGQFAVVAQETDDPVKISTYKRFVDNRVPNPDAAYQAARDYLAKYPKDKDQYTDYLTKWVAAYERDDRKRQLGGLINQKNFDEAYKVGAKILADEPDYLRAQIDLGYAGYLAASNKAETPESKAALEKLGVVMDRIADAYARAINVAGTDPKTEQSRKEWLAQMTTYYKFRHNNSDAGMTEFIAASMQKPLPPKP